MTVDPLYGLDSQPPDEDDMFNPALSRSDVVIREQLAELARKKDEHEKSEQRKQRRAPRDRQLKAPRRDR